MHIGFYVSSLGNTEYHHRIYNKLNDLVDSNQYDDVSLFYNDINRVDMLTKFGMFDSCELWSFTGTLFIESFDMIPQVKNTINKFKSIVVYNGEKNIFKIIDSIKDYEVLTNTKEDYDYIKRISGKEAHIMEDFNLTEFLELAK